MKDWSWIPLALTGALLVAACACLGQGGDLRHGALPGALVLYFVAAGAQLGALLWLARRARAGGARTSERWPRLLKWVVAVGVLARICLLPAPPSLSDDAWRYRWEGRVQAEGVNPYLTPPSDPSLAGLRDGGWLRVNHPDVPAIYGPPLQLLFRALARLPGPGVFWFKLAFLVADLGLLLLLIGGLRRRGLDPLWVLIYAWHPLVILEIAGQGHLEILPVALFVAALELEARGRSRLAAIALGIASQGDARRQGYVNHLQLDPGGGGLVAAADQLAEVAGVGTRVHVGHAVACKELQLVP